MNSFVYFEYDNIDISGLDIPFIENAVKTVLAGEGFNLPYEVDVNFVSDEEIRCLNLAHRRIDKVTDVLSFPMLTLTPGGFDTKDIGIGDYDLEGQTVLLGDIILSVGQANTQAAEYGNSLMREVTYLIIHSVLHLLGYDHQNELDKKNMRAREKFYVSKIAEKL